MLNLLKKTKPWMVASLLVATSVFGQDAGASSQKPGAATKASAPKCTKSECAPKPCPAPCPQPCPPTQMCPAAQPAACCPAWPVPVLNAAYNYPARTQTRCPWDVFVDASFIYWQALEENLEVGINANLPTGGSTTTQLIGNVLDMDYSYKPGFKVGLGGFFEFDNWDLHAEYTWFHPNNSVSYAIEASPATQAIYPFWGHPGFSGTNVYNTASAKWKMHMDIADLDLGRWYYVGTKLVFHTTFGARGAWIRQSYNVDYGNAAPYTIGTAQTTSVKSRSHSWAVGPKVGLDTYWNIGQGFRVFGCGEADILYTRYTRLSTNQYTTAAAPGSATVQNVGVKERNAGYLRPHVDLNLGIGWGTYWDCNNWYTDVALGYEFQVFFDQNMFRHYNSSTMLGNSNVGSGNLYTQGLTATFSLNF